MNTLNVLFKANFRRQQDSSGFTLIELLVVIIIIGILGAIALPAMLSQAAKARQAEAKSFIGVINRSQQSYMLEKQKFAPTLDHLHLFAGNQSTYYSYSIVTDPIQGSVLAYPLTDNNSRGYSGAATLYINEAVIKTIICGTKAVGTDGLATPLWDAVEISLTCPVSMQQTTQ